MSETTREDKIEAIIGICNYDRKLITATKQLAEDFSTGREKLPSEFLDTIMQGINWTTEVLNRVMDVLNEGEKTLEKQMINAALVTFNDAFASGDEKKLADAMTASLIPCLEQICAVGEQFA